METYKHKIVRGTSTVVFDGEGLETFSLANLVEEEKFLDQLSEKGWHLISRAQGGYPEKTYVFRKRIDN